MKKINEKELKMLFIELRHNKEKAFNNLYSKYGKLVYGIAFSILKNNADTEDVCQTVFTKIYNMENKKFPTEKEACWLYSLTKNESISYLRKKHNDINIEDIYDIEKDDQEIDYLLDKDEYNKLISRLDEKEKQVISLKILGNLSFKDLNLKKDICFTLEYDFENYYFFDIVVDNIYESNDETIFKVLSGNGWGILDDLDLFKLKRLFDLNEDCLKKSEKEYLAKKFDYIECNDRVINYMNSRDDKISPKRYVFNVSLYGFEKEIK